MSAARKFEVVRTPDSDPFSFAPTFRAAPESAPDVQEGSGDIPEPLELYARQGRERGYAHAIGDVLATLVLCTEQFIQDKSRHSTSEDAARTRTLLREFDDFVAGRIRSLARNQQNSRRSDEHDDPACFI